LALDAVGQRDRKTFIYKPEPSHELPNASSDLLGWDFMKTSHSNSRCFVGVDVSKSTLDVYRPDTRKSIHIKYSENATDELCRKLKRKTQPLTVVMEATGGYETLLLNQLAKHELDAAVVNPRRVRDFAKGIGIDAKTDPIDAEVISRYGEVVKPRPTLMKSDHAKKHLALVDRRNQLLELINQENNRLKQTWDEDAKKSIRTVLDCLKKQQKEIDAQLAKMLKADKENSRLIEILDSIKCVGPVLISTLITGLPELGRLNRGEIAKLVGVAPINRDSGKMSGKRFIGGGHGKVRRVLYMATVVGLRHNPLIKAHYAHLKSKGKESKVAIVACMRKLLTIMNTMVKTDQLWSASEKRSAR
jgi:transposase